MGILYKLYLGRLRLLRSSDGKENPGSRTSRRSCRVVHANIPSLHKNLSNLSLLSEVEMWFCFETLVRSRYPISELMILGFGNSGVSFIRSESELLNFIYSKL